MKVNVYVDGFNLYYGCLKNTRYRWLDLNALCHLMLPNDHINKIKYYTAKISARPHDPDQPVRQQTYLRALQTLPNVEIIYGHFLTSIIRARLAQTMPGLPATVEVIKTEEKGSDVNLATHLLHDGHLNRFETAVVVSNDSDLLEPIKIVINELTLPVGVLCPYSKNPSRQLLNNATFFKHIRPNQLAACQFPLSLTDRNGTFTKPARW